MNCPKCGRFMKPIDYFTNDHNDSFDTRWACANANHGVVSGE